MTDIWQIKALKDCWVACLYLTVNPENEQFGLSFIFYGTNYWSRAQWIITLIIRCGLSLNEGILGCLAHDWCSCLITLESFLNVSWSSDLAFTWNIYIKNPNPGRSWIFKLTKTNYHSLWLCCIFSQSPNSLACLFCMARNWIFTLMQFPAEFGFWLAIHGLLKAA